MGEEEPKIVYGGRRCGPGDELELFMHRSQEKETFIARDDEGVVMLPELGSRMIGEMIAAGAELVLVRAKILRIIVTPKGTRYAILRPIEWRPLMSREDAERARAGRRRSPNFSGGR